jgi:hypothetical protein
MAEITAPAPLTMPATMPAMMFPPTSATLAITPSSIARISVQWRKASTTPTTAAPIAMNGAAATAAVAINAPNATTDAQIAGANVRAKAAPAMPIARPTSFNSGIHGFTAM